MVLGGMVGHGVYDSLSTREICFMGYIMGIFLHEILQYGTIMGTKKYYVVILDSIRTTICYIVLR